MSDLKRAEHAAMRAAEAPGEADAAYRDEVRRIVKNIEADWRLILEQGGEPDCGMDEWVEWMCGDPQRLAVMTRVLVDAARHHFIPMDDGRRLAILCDEFVEQCAREQIASNIEAAAEFKRGGPRW